MQVIIYQQDDNRVAVVVPALEYSDQLEAVAAKDVPDGRPWRVLNANDLPSRETRDLWRWTESGPLAVE
jgi:hypothetical protein